jgi:hypothetical protein
MVQAREDDGEELKFHAADACYDLQLGRCEFCQMANLMTATNTQTAIGSWHTFGPGTGTS